MTLEFETAEDLYAHYQAVAHRIGSRRYVYPVVPVATGFTRTAQPFDPSQLALDAPVPMVDTVQLTPEEYWAKIEAEGLPKSRRAAVRMVEAVAKKHGLSVDDILGPSRKHPIMVARQEAYWWLYRKFDFSAPLTSEIVGNRDHTCVLQGVPRHEARQAQ
jgi:hypothetical protein